MDHRTGELLISDQSIEDQRPGRTGNSFPVAFNNLFQDAANLLLKFAPIPVVVHYIICTPPLLVKCHLGLLAFGQFLLIPAASVFYAAQPHRSVSIHENHGINFAVQTRFIQQRSIDDKSRGILRGMLKVLHSPLFDPGMRERFQPLALRWICENDLGDPGAIDLAIIIKDFLAPPMNEFIADGGIAQCRPGQHIGFRHDAAELTENPRHRRLARANAASDADDGRIYDFRFTIDDGWAPCLLSRRPNRKS